MVYNSIMVTKREGNEMPRLSITLTDSQNAALERLAAASGATKQSMIGIAVSQWISTQTWADVPQHEHVTLCEIEDCGKPATGGCVGPDGSHVYCDEHRYLFEDWEEL